MGRRRDLDADSKNRPSLAARLVLLCNMLWDGNKTQMGRDCGGHDQPTMSRVMAGKQQPPLELLAALAGRRDVNARWLISGQGDPRPAANEPELAGGHYCPIASDLLPGEPARHPELLTLTSMAVASAFYSPTAYWYVPRRAHPVTKARSSRVAEGDYVLIETGADWTRNEARYRGRLCVFRMGNPARRGFGVVLEPVFEIDGPFEVHLVHDPNIRAEIVRDRDGGADSQGPQVTTGGLVRFYRDDLVGVCRLSYRPLAGYPAF